MSAVVLLVAFAILFGLIGLSQGVTWLILIAIALLILGAFSGTRYRR